MYISDSKERESWIEENDKRLGLYYIEIDGNGGEGKMRERVRVIEG